MLLTDEERIRFADYLERDASSNDGMAKQLEGNDRLPDAIRITLVKQKRTLAMAQMIVAKELRSAESFSVGGK